MRKAKTDRTEALSAPSSNSQSDETVRIEDIEIPRRHRGSVTEQQGVEWRVGSEILSVVDFEDLCRR